MVAYSSPLLFTLWDLKLRSEEIESRQDLLPCTVLRYMVAELAW